jgi:endoribonuclease Dicer
VLQQFREGTLNVLIATNVAEEGLDFQACNLIVRFDFMSTYKGYVQSRGRARKKDSEFVVMLDRDEPKDGMRWKQYVGAEKQLDDIYTKREPDDALDEPELENTPRHYSAKTGAVLTYASAVALLDEICALIPSDAYSPPSRPRYELDAYGSGKLFSCTVHLPMMPLLPPNEREMKGPSVTTKKGAKQAVAYEACVRLHERGILSDHLLPIRESKGDFARDADDELVDRTVLPMHQEVDVLNPFGNLWSADKPPVWINEVRIEAPDGTISRFALVCATRLDLHTPLVMHEPGKEFSVRLTSLRKHVWPAELRYDNLSKLDKFTRWMIKQVINRKLIQGPLIYLVAPLFRLEDGSYDIDWDVIGEPFKTITSLNELSNGNLVLAPWQFMRKHIFTIHEIRRDLNSLNMPRITGLTKRGRIFDRTANFGDALVALLDYEGIDPKLNMCEEMLHLKPWFSVRNNLNPVKAHSARSATATAPATAPMTRDPSNHQTDPTMPGTQVDDGDDDIPLPAWELPDWKWRQYKVKQHEVDEEAGDMLDPEDSVTSLDPLPAGQTTATSLDTTNAFVLPWSLCKVSNIDIGVWNAFSWLPSLLRAIHDQARTQHAMREMALPPLQFSLVNQ